MRKLGAVLMLVASFGVCLSATGQQPTNQPPANSFFTGVNPRNIQSKNLVQPGKALKNYNVTSALRPQPKPSVFNVGRVFPKISLASWPPTVPTVGILNQKSNPFQPNPPKGINPFDPPKKK